MHMWFEGLCAIDIEWSQNAHVIWRPVNCRYWMKVRMHMWFEDLWTVDIGWSQNAHVIWRPVRCRYWMTCSSLWKVKWMPSHSFTTKERQAFRVIHHYILHLMPMHISFWCFNDIPYCFIDKSSVQEKICKSGDLHIYVFRPKNGNEAKDRKINKLFW